jgi:imidazolonepropionase-like amidohydrolase
MKLVKLDQNKNYILTTGPVIDAVAGKHLPKGTLYIEEGRIAAITRQGEAGFNFKYPGREEVHLDLGHLSVLPPLVDCHVHLALDGVDFAAARRRWDNPEELAKQVAHELRDTTRHGILAVRDGGDRRGIALQFRNMVYEGRLEGPLVKASVYALRKPNTYGSFLGRGTPMISLEDTLNDLVWRGADQVKVIVSGVVSFKEYGKVGPVQYSAGDLAAIVNLAHSRGMRVMAHASSDEAVLLAARAGVDTIEHGYFLSPGALELLAERGIAWIPTVVPVAAQLQNPDRQVRYVIEKTVDRQLAMINKATALGVTLGVGTDAGAAGVRHGYGYLQELDLYRQAGLTPAEIIKCATESGARILDLDWGRLEPGRPAALIAVEGDPLVDTGALGRVKYAFLPFKA